MTLRKEKKTGLERGRTRSLSVENSLWNRQWTFCKTDYVMTDLAALAIVLVTDEQTSMENLWNDSDRRKP
jgi:hypothetical protein